ncbi:hypothetical protein AU210_016264 [Fusarium oxysporum f. sp. radicis-cucumerinum]|uniref:Uncharacterized protein n=1 Tax=Fusarium oxysporum f. sp. radicis-cucumerinum TaxID=327505 RepID=A0A2H3G007_FUSOX|nr:hypothetical protein AU210_016264 [Fusarium oxysporum f. sp. radicis-cucumerinum]
MPINGRDDGFICLYCQGQFLEDTVYRLHILSCLAVQDLYGDYENQLLTFEEFVHSDSALSNLSSEFHIASTLQDSFVSEPQQQFHNDQEPPALFATKGATATSIRIHGKYSCLFCLVDPKTFAPPDSLKRQAQPCSHRKQQVLSLSQHPTGSPVSATSNTLGEGPFVFSPQAQASPDSKRRSNLRASLVHRECGTERIEDVINVGLVREADCQEHKSSTDHVDGDVANAGTEHQEQVDEHPDASTNTGCGHAETGDRTALAYETILDIALDRTFKELAPLSNTSLQVQIRLNRICDYYLQRDIEHAQEAESCDTGSYKAKQSDVKETTGAMTKSTISPAEDNDTHSKISKLKTIVPELQEVDLSKIPKDELHYVLDGLSAVKTHG